MSVEDGESEQESEDFEDDGWEEESDDDDI
jgi:hypothetical protein